MRGCRRGRERRLTQAEEAGGGVKSVRAAAGFLGANPMEFLPEGRVAKVHPAKKCLCASLPGPLTPGEGTCFRGSLGRLSDVTLRDHSAEEVSPWLSHLWLAF